MDHQQQQPQQQGFAEGQQAQWQPQFQQPMPGVQQPQAQQQGFADNQQAQAPQFQQPMPGMQHPQPQYAHLPPGSVPSMPTPDLNAMYQQAGQPNEQLYGQQFPDQQQVPQAPQAFAQPPQQAQQGMSMGPGGAAGQFYQQQAAPPGVQGQAYGSNMGTPGPQPGVNPDGSAWEQANVTEANNAAPFAGFDQPVRPDAQQVQAVRNQELFNARQRIDALEAEREMLEVQQALEISAGEFSGAEELEAQHEDQMYAAKMLSLQEWERKLRENVTQKAWTSDPNVGSSNDPYGMPHLREGPARQAEYVSYVSLDSRAASIVNPESISSPGPSIASHAPSIHYPAASAGNMGWNNPPPPPRTPTQWVSPEEVAYRRAQSAAGGSATPSEYTVHPEA